MSKEENIEEYVAVVEEIIDSSFHKKGNEEHEKACVRRDKFKKLLFEDIGEFYFTSPASSREQYHDAHEGGLVEHSIRVYENLKNLHEISNFDVSEGDVQESICISALLHDVGKCMSSNLKEPHYLPTTEKWKRDRGELFEYNQNGIYFPNHQRSMFMLQQFDFKLTADEYQAILLNDGFYIEENKGYRHKLCKLAFYLHTADMMSIL